MAAELELIDAELTEFTETQEIEKTLHPCSACAKVIKTGQIKDIRC